MNKIAEISPEESILIDKNDGSIDMQGKKIFIEENILSQLNIIKEGHFTEEEGAPAYKLKGEIKNFSGVVAVKSRPAAIHKNDLYNAFFRGKCDYPKEYLKCLVHESSYYLPIWFFIKESEKELDEICDMISSIDDCWSNIQKKILERIKNENINNLRYSSIFPKIKFDKWNFKDLKEICKYYKDKLETTAKKKILRSVIREFLIHDPQALEGVNFVTEHYDIVVEAITHLPRKAVQKNFEIYRKLLYVIRESIGGRNCETNFRKAVCYIDYCYYENL